MTVSPSPSPVSSAGGVVGWLTQLIDLKAGDVHIKLRGNILHVLCETAAPLDQSSTLLGLIRSLLDTDGNSVLQQTYPQVYQIYLYSRRQGEPRPEWTAPLYLNRLERHLAQLVTNAQDETERQAVQALLAEYTQRHPDAAAPDEPGRALVLSNLSLARQGDPDAIAWYLSETLSALDVGVWVSIRAIPGTAHLQKLAVTAAHGDSPPGAEAGPAPRFDTTLEDTAIPRLWILCEATYSPDPSLIAQPTAERLRQLELTQFKDAVLLLQVRGERQPDWSLRIDLTPPAEMLGEWARWGDGGALERLLQDHLQPLQTTVQVNLHSTTLHLSCWPLAGGEAGLDNADAIRKTLASALDTLAPQGIQRAVLYGQSAPHAEPLWVQYLDLPAAQHPALADPPEILAMYGDLPAIAFLLTRQLNPNLDDQLATGGLRVQLLPRDGLLHVMVDGPVTPWRRQVAPVVANYLLKLSPQGVGGVRVYGRRSGEAKPAWSYGQDFLSRQRLVPESTPEFSASDAYVNELLVRPDGPVVPTDLEDSPPLLGPWMEEATGRLQRLLLRSQLFALPSTEGPEDLPLGQPASDRMKIALVWGAIGVLLALQVDWLLGQILNPPTNPAMAEQPGIPQAVSPEDAQADANPFADLNWGSDPGESVDFDSTGDPGGFTAPPGTLAQSPEQPIVAMDELLLTSPFSTFNSQQMNEKLALYLQRLEDSGPPDVLVVGSSRALRGVDPVALKRELASLGYTDISVFNFGINGATAQVVDLIIRQALTPDQLPRLIVWADGARAFNSGREDVTYNAIVASPGYRELLSQRPEEESTVAGPTEDPTLQASYQALDRQLSDGLGQLSAVYPERDRLKAWLQDRLAMLAQPVTTGDPSPEEKLDAPMPAGSVIDFDGFLALSVRFNPATYYQDYARVPGRYDGDYEGFRLDGVQDDAFSQLLAFTQSQDLPIVFLNTPLTDEYLDDYRQAAEADFTRHMLQRSTAEEGFIFRDLATLWPQRYDYFSDPSHLNRYGAYQVSVHLAQDPLVDWPEPTADSDP